MPIPARQDPEALLAYAQDWIDDANDRWDMGMKSMAQESLRTAMMMYMRLPRGFSNLEFERNYQETSNKLYGMPTLGKKLQEDTQPKPNV